MFKLTYKSNWKVQKIVDDVFDWVSLNCIYMKALRTAEPHGFG